MPRGKPGTGTGASRGNTNTRTPQKQQQSSAATGSKAANARTRKGKGRANAAEQPQQPKAKTSSVSDGEIRRAFRLFAVPLEQLDDEEADGIDEDDDGSDDDEQDAGALTGFYVRVLDVRRCLTALGLPKPPPGFFDGDQKVLSGREFVELAQTMREIGDEDNEDEDGDDSDEDAMQMADDAYTDQPAGKANARSRGGAAAGAGKPAASGRRKARGGAAALSSTSDVDHAYSLFLHSIPSDAAAAKAEASRPRDDNRNITLADLRRIARELREDVDDKVLRLMMEEANGASGRDALEQGVSRAQFEEVMRRAGVFG